GAIPASLSGGQTFRIPPVLFLTSDTHYFSVRCFLSLLILTGAGLLLTIQARWLGLVASLGSRRPGVASSTTHTPVSAAALGVTP
ncbi:hypothetical protein NL533_33710, partial [Klebsiella pneumoniae]|nr:hypothetical protein [Klebsiella pneumoniae]